MAFVSPFRPKYHASILMKYKKSTRYAHIVLIFQKKIM